MPERLALNSHNVYHTLMTSLVELVNTTNPKNFADAVKREPALLAEVTSHQSAHSTVTINESIYCLVNNIDPVKCPCGKKALFNSYSKGYRKFCSPTCPEKGKKHSGVAQEMWKDETKLRAMIETRGALAVRKKRIPDTRKSTRLLKQAAPALLTQSSIGTDDLSRNEFLNSVSSLGVYIQTSGSAVLIPDHNLAIEFNGLYWHSEKAGKKSSRYHSTKERQCSAAGIQLLTIFEDEWLRNPTIILNHIRHLCGKTEGVCGARKVTITQEKYSDSHRDFLNKYHIQGKTEAVSHCLVGKVNDAIIAICLFRKDGNSYDIIRYCTDCNATYPGLFSKFISYASRELKMSAFTSIADLRWSQGDVYLKSGFEIDHYIAPDYAYTDYKVRYHKFNFRKSRIKSKFGIEVEGKSESELMASLGYDRIWDCGKIKFKFSAT